eukprot:GHVU01108876.1.p1 GENE.GHVU01108876.1~~GHVU01108876.1.p1  ORF type:complete len:106 (+),score=5.37 GHVU01108876.1:38-355(+)
MRREDGSHHVMGFGIVHTQPHTHTTAAHTHGGALHRTHLSVARRTSSPTFTRESALQVGESVTYCVRLVLVVTVVAYDDRMQEQRKGVQRSTDPGDFSELPNLCR